MAKFIRQDTSQPKDKITYRDITTHNYENPVVGIRSISKGEDIIRVYQQGIISTGLEEFLKQHYQYLIDGMANI